MNKDRLYAELGRAVLVRRKQLNLTQAAIANKVGISRESVANIEAGRQRVSLHHVYGLADALHLKTIGELIPLSTPKEMKGQTPSLDVSGDSISGKQLGDVERLMKQALGEPALGEK